jgi:hypothetical protein
MRPALEVADIFRRNGGAYRTTHGAHMGRDRTLSNGGARRTRRGVRGLRLSTAMSSSAAFCSTACPPGWTRHLLVCFSWHYIKVDGT